MIIIWQKKKLKFLRMFCHVKRKLNVAKKIQNRKKNVSKAFGELVKNMPILKKNLTQHMWVCHRDCRFLNFDDQRILLSFYIQVHSPHFKFYNCIFIINILHFFRKTCSPCCLVPQQPDLFGGLGKIEQWPQPRNGQ